MKQFAWSYQFAMYLYNKHRVVYEDAFKCADEFHRETDSCDWLESCPVQCAKDLVGEWEYVER